MVLMKALWSGTWIYRVYLCSRTTLLGHQCPQCSMWPPRVSAVAEWTKVGVVKWTWIYIRRYWERGIFSKVWQLTLQLKPQIVMWWSCNSYKQLKCLILIQSIWYWYKFVTLFLILCWILLNIVIGRKRRRKSRWWGIHDLLVSSKGGFSILEAEGASSYSVTRLSGYPINILKLWLSGYPISTISVAWLTDQAKKVAASRHI